MQRPPNHLLTRQAPATVRADMPPRALGPENWRRDVSPLTESFVECGILHFGFTAIPVPDAAASGLPAYTAGRLFGYGLLSVRVDEDTGQECKIHGIRLARRGFSDGVAIANAVQPVAGYSIGANAAILLGINLAESHGFRQNVWTAPQMNVGNGPTPRLPYQASALGANTGQWSPLALVSHAYYEFPQSSLESVGQATDNERESPLAWTAPRGSTIDAVLLVNGNLLANRDAVRNTLYGWAHGQIRCSLTRNQRTLTV